MLSIGEDVKELELSHTAALIHSRMEHHFKQIISQFLYIVKHIPTI